MLPLSHDAVYTNECDWIPTTKPSHKTWNARLGLPRCNIETKTVAKGKLALGFKEGDRKGLQFCGASRANSK